MVGSSAAYPRGSGSGSGGGDHLHERKPAMLGQLRLQRAGRQLDDGPRVGVKRRGASTGPQQETQQQHPDGTHGAVCRILLQIARDQSPLQKKKQKEQKKKKTVIERNS